MLVLLLLLACAPSGDDTAAPAHPDRDGDGVDAGKDCDDTNPEVSPRADEVCNGIDDDCDGDVDEDPSRRWYPDEDGDGFGAPGSDGVRACTGEPGTVDNDHDCADDDPAVFPGAAEVCNHADDDCDGIADEGVPQLTWSRDADGDGTGDPADQKTDCAAVTGYVDNALDCNDRSAGDPAWVDHGHGSDGNDGTLNRPLKTIHKAIGTSATCVYVQPGVYAEDIAFDGRSPYVASVGGSSVTTIQGTGRGPVVRVDSGEAPFLTGFTLTGGTGDCLTSQYNWDGVNRYEVTECYGGAIHVGYGWPTFRDLSIVGNGVPLLAEDDEERTVEFGYGGGISVLAGAVTMQGVSFVDDAASYGGAVYLAPGTSLAGSQVAFLRGEADYGAALMAFGAGISLQNVIVDGPITTSGYSGIYVYGGSTLTLDHATVADMSVGLLCADGSSVTVTNSIFAHNVYGLWDVGRDCTWRGSYLDTFDNPSGDFTSIEWPNTTGFQSGDPAFLELSRDQDGTDDDLHLGEGSAAVDAGAPGAEPDVDGSAADLGAYGGPNGAW